MNEPDLGSAAELRLALYTSSLGNYFFREIAELIGAGLSDLGIRVRLCSEQEGFAHNADWHLVVAPHEFFQLGAGENLTQWPTNLILFNTEQPSTQWFASAQKCFPRARFIWDIDFESSLRIARLGFDCSYLPLGYASRSPLFAAVPELPLHEATQELSAEIRQWNGDPGRLEERPLDLLFLGHSSTRREQFFSKHAASLRRFNCHFHKSNVARPLIPGETTSMNTATSIGLSQRSKVLLNVHHGVDKYFEWHRIVLLGVAQRTLVVSEPCSLAPPFRANVDYVEAPLNELPARLRYFLASEEGQAEAQAITQRAYETLTTRCKLSDMLHPLVKRLGQPPGVCDRLASPLVLETPVGARTTKQPKSICVVAPDLTGEGREKEAGAAQVALAEALAKGGHHVTLLHSHEACGKDRSAGFWLGYFAERGVTYVGLPLDARFPLDAPDPLARSYLTWEWLRQRSFQVVHFPDALGSAYYSLLGKRQGLGLQNTLLNVCAQGPRAWQRRGDQQFLNEVAEAEIDFLERESIRLAETLTVPTQYLLDWFNAEEWSIPLRTQVIPNVWPRGRHEFPPNPSGTQPCSNLVFVGSLALETGIELLCDAMDLLPAELHAGLSVRFFGNQGMINGRKCVHYIRQRSGKWSCGSQVLRSDDPSVMWDVLRRAGSLAVIPALMHNSPAAVRNCLAWGIPFLTTSVGGVTELIEPADQGRTLFAPNPKALAQLIEKCLREGVAHARPAQNASAGERIWSEWHETVEPALPASALPVFENAAEWPKVSVALVHYNRPDYLRQALASLEAQDYPNFEVVLVDDGSTRPQALEYLASLEPIFQARNWKLVRQENRYLGAARNTAARHAQGDYLLFMDDDNYAKPRQLSTFVQVARRTGADILTCAMDLFTGQQAPSELPKARWLFLGGAVTAGAFRNVFGDANALVRREVFERLGGFTEDYGVTHEDWEFHARAVLEGCRLEFIPEALFWYRYTPGSMIHHTSKFANHQRSLRPYLAKAPEPLRDLLRLTQGFKFQLDEFSGSRANYAFTQRLINSLLSAGKFMAEVNSTEADRMFMEVLQCAEGLENHGLHIDALSKTAKTLADLGRTELAIKLAQRAVKLAESTANVTSVRECRSLLQAIKSGQSDLAAACAGMRFLDEQSETAFLQAPAVDPEPQVEGNVKPLAASASDPSSPATGRGPGRLRVGVLCAEPVEFACPYLRVHSVLERLRERGAIDLLPVGHFQQGGLQLYPDAFQALDILVVQRQVAGWLPWSDLRRLTEGSTTRIVFEIDDALTELPEWHRAHAAYWQIRPQLVDYLRGADLVTVSTPELKVLYSSYNSNIEVLPNVVDERLWSAPNASSPAVQPVRILFSGTLDHERDLGSVEDAVLEVLEAYPDRVEFVYWGNVTEKLRTHPRVSKGPEFTPDYHQYASTLRNLPVSFAIVPLADVPFNRSKSAIKWLEYGMCGIPAVFSNVPAYRGTVLPGQTGWLASSREEWVAHMKCLIERPDLRTDMARAAREAVLATHTVEVGATRWEAAYRRLLSRPTTAHTTAVRVSVVIPTFNQLKFTRQCLTALAAADNQTPYEVVVVDNGSTDATPGYLQEAERTGRLRTVLNQTNLGFAKACNQGARTAAGEYLVFLNNDTEVTPGWLDALVAVADRDSEVAAVGSKLLFPDGTLQHAGVVLAEFPGRDPLLAVHAHYRASAVLAAANQRHVYPALTAACLLVRKATFEAVGSFDEEFFNGYEDVDLCLRLQERGWLSVYEPGSVVVHHESQSGPQRFERVQENIRRLHSKWLGKVTLDARCLADGSLQMLSSSRVRPYQPNPDSQGTLTSIVILTHNQLADTKLCLDSIAAHTPEPHEIIVVDNGSTDGTPEYLRALAGARRELSCLFNDSNLGFAAGNNQGLARARGDNVVLLNNDTVVTPGWLRGLLSVLKRHPEAGLVGPMTNYVSGPQLVKDVPYRHLDDLPGFACQWAAQQIGQTQAIDRLVGFCLLLRRAVVQAIGGLDERYGSGNFEDDDYCLRAGLAGFRALVAREVYIHHTGSQTFRGAKIDYRASMLANWRLFKAKWGLPAEAPIEQGYRLPLRLKHPAELNVALPGPSGSDGATQFIEVPAAAQVGNLKAAYARLAEQDLTAAWQEGVEALRRRPFHPEAWLVLAEVAWNAGQQNLVKQCVTRAEQLTPKWKPVRKFLKKHPARLQKQVVELPALPDPKPSSLSVCLIVRNEEEMLPRCLNSVREIAQQIVVVDTGSTDRSIELARELGAEVFEAEWTDDFSAARNIALEKALGDWVLVLDADEELPATSRAALAGEMRRSDVLACRLPIVDAGREQEGASYVPRLFRNAPGLFFVGRIHEQVFTSLEVRRRQWSLENCLGEAILLHHGYSQERMQSRQKVERNLRLLEQAVLETPNEPNLLMNLGLELVRSGRKEQGVQRYWEAVQALSALPAEDIVPELRETLLTQMATQLTRVGDYSGVVRLLHSPMARAVGLTASLHFSAGLALMNLQRTNEAIGEFQQCLAKRDQPGLCPINTEILTAAPRHCLAICLWQNKQIDQAALTFQEAYSEDPGSRPVRLDQARFLAETGDPLQALKSMHQLMAEDPTDPVSWRAGGRLALTQPEFLQFALEWTGESVKHLADHSDLAALRGEALLLAGQLDESLEFWNRAAPSSQQVAAQVLCLTALGRSGSVAASQEPQVSQDFLGWYRRLIEFECEPVVRAVNDHLELLRPVLPTVTHVLDAALLEVR